MPFPLLAPLFGFLKWAFTTASMTAFLVRTAIVMGASMLLNRALAPSIREPRKAGGIAFGPQTVEGQGEAIQVALGSNRVHANIVGHYVSVDAVTTESPFYWFGVPVGDETIRRTRTSRHILACFGEGPWQQPDDATVRLNGRPLSDTPAITATWRLGTVDQTVLPGWSVFRQDYNVGQVLHEDTPVTMALPKAGWDDLDVHISFRQGAVKYDQEGGTTDIHVGVKIEVGDADLDDWTEVAHEYISLESRRPIRLSYTASASNPGGTPYILLPTVRPHVRVTRTSSEYNSVRVVDECEFTAVQVVKNVAFTHPGMVLLDLASVPTELTAGGVTELSVESAGKIVADGSGGFGPSRYHADAVREVLTQPVIEGDGGPVPWSADYCRGVDPDDLVESGFAAQKVIADQLVPDGRGKDVAMLRFDAVFQSAGSAYDAVGQICAAGRCGLSYIGRSFGLWVESPRTPVGIVCDGNWARDSAHDLVPMESEELASEVLARYRDEDSAYAERTILVPDPSIDTLTTVNLDLIGTTRTHEVARLARRELARNRLVDSSLTCRGDIDLAIYEPGDVLYAQIDGRSLGGRIAAVDGLVLTLDRDLGGIATGADAVAVQVRDPITQIQSVQFQSALLLDDRTIQVSQAWTITPQVGDVYLFGPAGIADDQFEVLEVGLDERLHVDLAMTKYAPALDDLDGLGPDVAVAAAAIQKIYQQGGVVTPILPQESADQIAQQPAATFSMGNFVFYNTGGAVVGWEPYKDAEGNSLGYVRYEDALYHPAADAVGTDDQYVYWDPATPDVFCHTDDPADLNGMYLVAINDAGTPYEKHGLPIGRQGWTVNLDDVLDGASFKKMTAAERIELSDLATAPSDIAALKSDTTVLASDRTVGASHATALRSDVTILQSDRTVGASHGSALRSDVTILQSDRTAGSSNLTVGLSHGRVAVSNAKVAWAAGDYVNCSDVKVSLGEILTALSDALK